MSNSLDLNDVCGICKQELPLVDFGINTARPNGRNLYCKNCRNEKAESARARLRAYRASREAVDMLKSHQEQGAELPPAMALDGIRLKDSRLPLTERILEAIQLGHRGYKDIQRAVRIEKYESRDRFGEAIAKLLLDTRQIRYEGEGDSRCYFIREAEPMIERRHSAASFSTLGGIVAPLVRGKAA